MTIAQKLTTGLLTIGVITVLTLPDRKTAQVAGTFFGGLRGLAATFMGTGKQV